MKEEIVEANVLCVGGGVAGLMAAIRAREIGATVVVADKANPVRSGCAATGNDHFRCYIPEAQGQDIQPIVHEILRSQAGGMRNVDFARTWMEKSFEIVKLWDSWGIPMKYNGQWEFAGHAFPGRPFTSLKFSGQATKPVLTEQARKGGAVIIDRVMIFDMLRGDDGTFVALGIGTREERFYVIKAKAVILGTGVCTRLYPSSTPGLMFNMPWSPNNTGDGRIMAYRLGAELVNVELTDQWAGPKYFARAGKATWVGVLRDPKDKPVGPFVTKPDKRYGDVTSDVWHELFQDYWRSGKGPVYMDCRGISEEDHAYMMHWLKHEGNTALVNNLAEEEVDVRESPVEFTTYEMILAKGVFYNEKAETSVKGLYAAGDEFFGGISHAAIFGWIAGENAARLAKDAGSSETGSAKKGIEDRKHLVNEILNRKKGATWQEVNIALQQIMEDYAGSVRSETLLEAGLNYLHRLKKKADSLLMAKNQHELMHCLEVLNLIDLGELLFITARERKETRGRHIRADYTFTNPLAEKFLIVKKVNGRPVTEWREVKR